MPDTPISLWDLVTCPVSGQNLSVVDGWLVESEDGESQYPIICGTPILQADLASFMDREQLAIVRALARWGDSVEVRGWFHDNFAQMEPPLPTAIDSELVGEGYPGLWEMLPKPPFLDFNRDSADELINEVFADRHQKLALDLGCGQGGMMQRMASTCVQVVGVESNYYLAALANKLLRADHINSRYFDPREGWLEVTLNKAPAHNASVICADLNQLPFHQPMFDWVHCGHVLDLIDEPAEMLDRVMRILKPGGRLSISSPWDFEWAGQFDALLEMLDHHFTTLHVQDGLPWVRWNHRRRFLVHEDWVWIGKL